MMSKKPSFKNKVKNMKRHVCVMQNYYRRFFFKLYYKVCENSHVLRAIKFMPGYVELK